MGAWALAADYIRKSYDIYGKYHIRGGPFAPTKGGKRLYKAVTEHLDFLDALSHDTCYNASEGDNNDTRGG